MSLYRAETRRLLKRRFTKMFTIGALLALAAIAVGMALTHEKVGADQVARAQVRAQAEYEQAVQQATRDKQACEAAQGTPQASQFPPDCDSLYTPQASEFDPEWFMPATFTFREKFPDMVTALAALLALAAFVIGASFVGAEWNTGGMMNLLLWQPRRLKVLGTKLAALLVGLTTLTVLTSAVWTGVFWLIARYRGSTDKMTPGAWQSMGLRELRALALVLVVGAVGFGLASLGRHTAMALGTAIGVVVLFQFGLGTVLSLAQVKFAEAYLIPMWMIAWMDKSITLEDGRSCNFSTQNGCEFDTLTLTWQMAGGVLAGVFVLIVGAAMWTMRKRDIT